MENATTSDEPKKKGIGVGCILAAVIGVMVLFAVIGIVAAIAIPSFLKYKTAAKQSEAQMNLKSIYVAQASYFAETETYGSTFATIGWEPFDAKSYTDYLADDVAEGSQAASVSLPEDVDVAVTAESWRAAAVGNVDQDETLDIWVIDQDNQMVHLLDDRRH